MRQLENVNRCTGHGGKNCRCCFPAPGTRARRYIVKSHRRKLAKLHMKEELGES